METFGQIFPTETSFGQIVTSYLAVYGAPLLGYVLMRALMVGLTLRLMMRRTSEVSEAAPATAAGESATLPPPADLAFFELDAAKGILLNDRYEDRLERALQTGRRTWNLLWQSFFVYGFTATVVLLGFLTATDGLENSQLALGIFVAVLCLFGVLLLVLVGSHYRSIRRVTLLTSVNCLVVMTVISVVGGELLGMPFSLYLLPVLSSAIPVFQGYGRIRSAARREGNLKLLILRVFGSDRNTSFVFGPLMRSWQFLGSHFTVVDPSYIRYQSSFSSGETRWKLSRLFALYGALIGALSFGASSLAFVVPANSRFAALKSLSRMQQQELIGLVAWLVLIPLAVLPMLFVVRRRFIRNLPALERRVSAARKQTGGWRGIFKGFPMYCYDNVWKRAVNALLGTSDVVLMDLRGFSPARAGCEYEIGLLIDQYPIRKTIFLVDQAETRKDVHELIRRRWSAMSGTSPNRDLTEPIVKTYAPGDAEKRDIARILALLAASADKSDGGESAMVSFEGAEVRREGGRVAAPKSIWRRLPGRILESLDMVVTNRKVAAVITPLMLLAVLGLLFWRVRPVVRSLRALAPKSVSIEDMPSAGSPAPASTTGVKLEARAGISSMGGERNGRQFSNPIEVGVDLTGGELADAIRYGKIHLTSATDPAGASLEDLGSIGFDGPTESGFSVIDRADTDFFTGLPEHPADGLRLKLYFVQPVPKIPEVGNLTGNLTVQMPDPARMLQIENAGAQLAIPGNVQLDHPKLSTLGKVSLVVNDNDRESVQVVIESRHLEDVLVRAVDTSGKALRSGGSFQFGDSKSFVFPIKDGALDRARLDIIWGYRSIVLPFAFKNVKITPAEESMGSSQ